jgi:hypothetical protein
MSDILGGQATPIVGTANQSNFMNALMSSTVGANGQLQGVQGYQGPLSPQISSTILPQAAAAWNPQGGAGQQYLQDQLANPSQAYFNTTPEWQQMVGAQQQNIQANQAAMGQQFNSSGNFGGTGQGIAESMYSSQTAAQQNALLGQMQQGAFNTGQSNLMQAAGQQGQLANQNLQTGAGIGQQQYNIGQSQINNQYQNWLTQQPQNNPLLSFGMSAAGAYPQYQPGTLGSTMSGLGSLLGGLGQVSSTIA